LLDQPSIFTRSTYHLLRQTLGRMQDSSFSVILKKMHSSSILIFLILFFSFAARADFSPSEKAFHVYNRLAFGPRPGDLEALEKIGAAGLEKWINDQLHPETISDTAVETKLAQLKSYAMTIPQLRAAYPKPKGKKKRNAKGEEVTDSAGEDGLKENAAAVLKENSLSENEFEKNKDGMKAFRPRRILLELIDERLIRATESKRQLQEVMLDFWFNHFNIDFNKGQVKYFLVSYERDTLRPRLFGKFRDMLGAVAKSPGMLFYLDNFKSVRDGFVRPKFLEGIAGVPKVMGLNENYGRELMELHTLGVDGGYTQNDVRETARAFTGWSLEQPQKDTEFKFRPRTHDDAEKHILGVTFPANGGIQDGEKVLDRLAKSPATAKFIAKKLCIKFISDHPPASAIQKVADTFLKTDGDLRAVYSTLFHLPEFWAKDSVRAKIKLPWEFTVSAARALNSTVVVTPRGPLREFMAMQAMGEPLYQCQPPTGFKASSDYWVNPGALVTRINFSLALANDRLPEFNVDDDYFRNRLHQENATDLENAVDHLNNWILAGEMRKETRTRLVAELDSEEKVVAESDINNKTPHHAALHLNKLLGLVLGSPDFQRR
jgi:uncharacterized protein (DUF1800 family)